MLFSETIKRSNVPWLIELLKSNKVLSKKELSYEQLQIINEIRSDLLNDSIEEWSIAKAPDGNLTLDMGQDERKWAKCQLCGTKHRYMHYIKNKFTDSVINVGSACIGEFGEIGKVAQRDRRSLVSAQAKNRRLLTLLEEIPNAKSRIDKWNALLNEIDLILPRKIEEPYMKLGKEAEKTFKAILRKNKNEREVKELKAFFIKQEGYKEEILKYDRLNKDKPFVMTKKIDDWLRINRPKDYTRIRETVQNESNGFIGSEIAHEINEPGFLNMLANKYNNNIESDIIKVKQITNNGFVLSVAPLFNVDLEISNRLFTKEYVSFAYGKKGTFENKLLLVNSRCSSNGDKSKLIEEYIIMLSKIGMQIVNVESKKDRMDIKNLNPKKYFREDLDKFIEKNKLFLYLNKQEELKREILKNNNTFTESEYKNLIKREKEIKAEYLKDLKR